jgi:hypothetical protein
LSGPKLSLVWSSKSFELILESKFKFSFLEKFKLQFEFQKPFKSI